MFIIVLLISAGLLVLIAAMLMARLLIRPPRMTDAKASWVLRRLSPGDLSLPFAPASFRVRDQRTGEVIDLAAWWIPSPQAAGRCVVLLHGYADAKVGAIAWAPFLHALGFNILVSDFRAHGESGGRLISAGFWERHDLNQLIDQLRAERPDDTRELVIHGLSYGAMIGAAAAVSRDDLAGIVLENPLVHFHRAAAVQSDLLGLPGGVFQRLAIWLAQKLIHADWRQLQVPRLIREIRCPLMLINCGQDVMVSASDRAELERALADRRQTGRETRYLFAADSAHLMAMQTETDAYTAEVGRFLLDCTAELGDNPA